MYQNKLQSFFLFFFSNHKTGLIVALLDRTIMVCLMGPKVKSQVGARLLLCVALTDILDPIPQCKMCNMMSVKHLV